MGTAVNNVDLNGIGMTSQRTRERLIQRLVDQGISNKAVLDVIRITPRHMFLDEAMAHRAYEDTALPIGYQQTLSQPYIVARMTELLLAGGPLERVLDASLTLPRDLLRMSALPEIAESRMISVFVSR